MARTIKIAKYIQIPEPRGLIRPANRRVPAKPPALYLVQLRAKSQLQFAPRRLQIVVNVPDNSNFQSIPVKIQFT